MLYDRSLLYLDSQVTRFLEALQRLGLFEDTVVIVTADHGESFGEHGYFRHDRHLYDEVIRVPLYLKPSGVRRETVSADPIAATEIFPLALRELGLEDDARPAHDGTIAEWYRFAEERRDEKRIDRDLIVWLEGSVKFIASSKGEVEAYDLLRDPREELPLKLSDARVEAARQRANGWWETHPPPGEVTPVRTDAEALERLRVLGYLE